MTGSPLTYRSNSEVKPPTGAATFTFFVVNDTAASGQSAQPSTVPLTVYDGRGLALPWTTFVGGGINALQSTASIADTQVAEGNAGNTVATFTVTLSVPSARTITIGYTTADCTARAGQDYVAASGTVTFNPGETTKTIAVQVRGNFTAEPDKTFTSVKSGTTGGVNALIEGSIMREVGGTSAILTQVNPQAGILLNSTIRNNQIITFRGLGGSTNNLFTGTGGMQCSNISGNTFTDIVSALRYIIVAGDATNTHNVTQLTPTAAVDINELDDANGAVGHVLVSGSVNPGSLACDVPSF